MAEKEAFRREVADWEAVRQLWQFEREAYIAEKTHHRNLSKKMNRRHRPGANASDGDDLYEDEWGDQPGQNWFDSSTSIDRAIDDELDDGASPIQVESSGKRGSTMQQPIYSPIPVPDPEEIRKRKIAEEKARKLRAAEEKRRREEEERRAREEEARRKKEQEAAAGAAAAEALMKQQEEEIRKEQEAIRKKSGVEVDKEGQVVDPELKKEISEEGEEEEED